jgi:hypothetical protein
MFSAEHRLLIRRPAKLAGLLRHKLPGRTAVVSMLVGLAQPLLAVSSGHPRPEPATERSVAPIETRLSTEGLDGFGWGLPADRLAQLARMRGYEPSASLSGETMELQPAAGLCRTGWAHDRACERILARFRLDASGVRRLHAVTVETTLPSAISAEEVLGGMVARLGTPSTVSASEGSHPREQPEIRYHWQIHGAHGSAHAELALPSLLMDNLRSWRLVASEPKFGSFESSLYSAR